MKPLRNRIVTRLVLLAAITTMVTIAAGTIASYATLGGRQRLMMTRVPTAARKEMRQLIASGESGGQRFTFLYDLYRDDGRGRRDSDFVRYVSVLSAVLGGALFGGVAAIMMARRISRPIVSVASAAARVAAGERSVRIQGELAFGEVATLIDSFNAMAAEIEFYERERKVLTAGIAHELRTPLTILKGRLHGLTDGVIEPAKNESERLLRQVNQLSLLVDDLRTFSHADAGELRMSCVSIAIDLLLRDIVADLRDSAETAEVTLDGRYLPATIHGDPLRVTQILTNLLTNAIKHAPRLSTVTISMRKNGPRLAIDVLDQGEGFAPGELSQLFIPFWRGSIDRKLGRPGSGLGLALASKLAEAHGAEIRATNRPDGLGAHFEVSFLTVAPTRNRQD